jgi:hypothetical protein
MATFIEEYKVGHHIFEKLFKLNSNDLKIKLKKLLIDNVTVDQSLFSKDSIVHKSIENDIPNEITINWYNEIKINSFGIYYKPEYDHYIELINFYKSYNIVNIVNELKEV